MSEQAQEAPKQDQAHFEEQIFHYRFIMSIGPCTPEKQRGVGMPLGASCKCPHKSEFCRKDGKGNYLEPFVAGAWWALNEYKPS